MAAKERLSYRVLVIAGNALTVTGCVGLLLAASGLIDAAWFSLGISSGIRVIGTVAITGCLLSAIGYGIYFKLAALLGRNR